MSVLSGGQCFVVITKCIVVISLVSCVACCIRSCNSAPSSCLVECPLCKGRLGFAANPNNCQDFYMCTNIDGIWAAHNMSCPDCTFWDQELLTCARVSDNCVAPTAMTGPPMTGLPINDLKPGEYSVDSLAIQ